MLQSLARAETGLIVRPADAEIIPPLSDYNAFWRRQVPFLFLTAGGRRAITRSRTPKNTSTSARCWRRRVYRTLRPRDQRTARDPHSF